MEVYLAHFHEAKEGLVKVYKNPLVDRSRVVPALDGT
jgi:hypothetical protein